MVEKDLSQRTISYLIRGAEYFRCIVLCLFFFHSNNNNCHSDWGINI